MEHTGQVNSMITCRNIGKTFSTKKTSLEVLQKFDLDVKENEFVVLFGAGAVRQDDSYEYHCRVGAAYCRRGSFSGRKR